VVHVLCKAFVKFEAFMAMFKYQMLI